MLNVAIAYYNALKNVVECCILNAYSNSLYDCLTSTQTTKNTEVARGVDLHYIATPPVRDLHVEALANDVLRKGWRACLVHDTS